MVFGEGALSVDEVVDIEQVLSMVDSDEFLGEGLIPRHELHVVQVDFRDEGYVHLCTDRVESDRKRSVCRILIVEVDWLRVETSGQDGVKSIQCASLSKDGKGCVRVGIQEVLESMDLVVLKSVRNDWWVVLMEMTLHG
jgi:hypothetical protein